jgi:translation elongation factor P/translation initiation factor 5A
MKIQKGKYILNGDGSCYWISQLRTSKQGKEYEVTVSGYHRRIADVTDSFLEGTVRNSEAEDIKTLLSELKDAVRVAQDLVRGG